MANYSAGSAGISIVPDFSGFVSKVNDQANQAASSAAQVFSSAFSEGVKRALAGLQVGPSDADTAKQGDSAGGAFADAFKRHVEAALQALPAVAIDADSSEADRKLADLRAQLEELSGKQVGVDISDEEASAKLDELKASLDELGRKSESVQVKVDTASASAELAAFRAEMDALTSGGGGSGGGATVFDGIAQGAQNASSSVTPLVAAIALVGPALIPIGAAATAGLGAIVSTALTGGAALGVLYLGLSDVVKAIEAVTTANQSSGAAAASSAKTQEAAANQVRSAQATLANTEQNNADAAVRAAQAVATAEQSLADAVRTASNDQITAQENLANASAAVTQARVTGAQQVAAAEQGLQSAEQSLTNAVYSEQQAQEALVAARQSAQRQLESYQQQVADGALQQRQDILNVQTAQANLNTVMANSGSTDLQKQQAQLSYDQAVQALKDQQENYQNLVSDANAAAAAGVDGSAAVQTAQHNLLTSQQGVASAQQSVASAHKAVSDAQIAAAQNVAAAIQRQGDVERQVAQQEISDQEKVASARQGVTNAIDAQAQQARQAAFSESQARAAVSQALYNQQTATAGVNSAQQTANAALAKLTPTGRSFVTFVTSELMPAFSGLKGAAENALLPGLRAGIAEAMPIIQPLTGFVGDLAKVMGDLFVQAGKALTDPFWTKFFGWVSATAGPMLQSMATIVGDFAKGFAGMLQAFSPATDAIGHALEGVAGKFAAFATNTQPGSPLERFVSFVQQSLPKVGDFLDALGHALENLGKAAGGAGLTDLSVMSDALKLISDLPVGILQAVLDMLPGLILGIKGFGVAMAIANAAIKIFDLEIDANPLALIIMAVVAAVVLLGVGIYELVTHWSEVWGAITSVASDAWHAITDAFSVAWNWIVNVFEQYWPLLLGILTGPIGLAVGEIIQHWSDIEGAFSDAWAWVSKTFSAIWDGAKDIVTAPISDAVTAITGFFGSKGPLQTTFSDVWGWLSGTWSTLWNGARDLVTGPISNAISDITGFFGSKGPLQGAFGAVWDWLSKTWSALWAGAEHLIGDPIDNAVSAIGGFFGPKGPLQGAFNAVWGWVSGTFKSLWSDEKTGIGAIITGPLQGVAAVVSGVWDDITKAFTAGVNGVIGLMNDFIHGIDDVVGAIPGLPKKLIPDIPLIAGPPSAGNAKGQTASPATALALTSGMATGGILPGYAPGVDRILSLLSPGEAVLRPEVARWLGPDTIHGWNAAAMSGRLPGYATGGMVDSSSGGGWSLNPFTDAKKIVKDVAGDALSAALGPVKAAADAAIGLLPDSFVKTMAQGVVNYVLNGVSGLGSSSSGSGATSPSGPVSAGVTQWTSQVLQALGMLGQPATLLSAVLRRMNQESGGDPSAVNRWDSNWVKGTPSVGLMQVIGPTFGEYAGPFASTGPFLYGTSINPLANIFAGLNYAIHDYPSLAYAMNKAGGYDSGGLASGVGLMLKDVVSPERVLSPQQTQDFGRLVDMLDAGLLGPNSSNDALLTDLAAMMRSAPQEMADAVASGVDNKLKALIDEQAHSILWAARTGGRR